MPIAAPAPRARMQQTLRKAAQHRRAIATPPKKRLPVSCLVHLLHLLLRRLLNEIPNPQCSEHLRRNLRLVYRRNRYQKWLISSLSRSHFRRCQCLPNHLLILHVPVNDQRKIPWLRSSCPRDEPTHRDLQQPLPNELGIHLTCHSPRLGSMVQR